MPHSILVAQIAFGLQLLAIGVGIVKLTISLLTFTPVITSQCRGSLILATSTTLLWTFALYLNNWPISDTAKQAGWVTMSLTVLVLNAIGIRQILQPNGSEVSKWSVALSLIAAVIASGPCLFLELMLVLYPSYGT